MIAQDKEEKVTDQAGDSSGKIPLCPKKTCGFKCCQFQQGNYIVLYPGELEEAKIQGKSTQHLKFISNDKYGGTRGICKASDTSNCDKGYKPLDCSSYPLFPNLEKGDSEIKWFLKGIKCPLQIDEIHEHIKWVLLKWNRLIQKNPFLKDWLQDVKMVGYEINSFDISSINQQDLD
ncbi:MAG: hypothetical protein RMY36_023495 [Nostoc sp. SerVER01]|nr:hypothetical protein [Nostoc sp. SerVER01]